jgi:hypothetical protein
MRRVRAVVDEREVMAEIGGFVDTMTGGRGRWTVAFTADGAGAASARCLRDLLPSFQYYLVEQLVKGTIQPPTRAARLQRGAAARREEAAAATQAAAWLDEATLARCRELRAGRRLIAHVADRGAYIASDGRPSRGGVCARMCCKAMAVRAHLP